MFCCDSIGAKIIEKHFTIDNKLEGPDRSCSLDPKGFKDLVHGIRQIRLL